MSFHKSVASVEIVSIQRGKRFVDGIFGTPNRVGGTPGFFPFNRGHTSRQFIHILKTIYGFYQAFSIFTYKILKFFCETFPDDENNFIETGMNGIVNGIMQQCFFVRTERGDLFQTTEAGTHACGHDKKSGLVLHNVIL